MIGDSESFVIEERVVLSKFEGDALLENEIERVHIVNGEVVLLEKIENGEVVSSETVKEV